MKKKVLVAGASGLVGNAAVRMFAAQPGWQTVGVSRRTPADIGGATFQPVDLTDERMSREVFSAMSDVTHLVYAALREKPGLVEGWTDEETIRCNVRMLRNLFEPLSEAAAGLEHVSLMQGTKAYGMHHPTLGFRGVKLPLRERDARRPHRNFYFDQEAYLQQKQESGSWGITIFRPTVIYGDAPGNNMNPMLPIALYAALLWEQGRPLDFPGRSVQPWLREAVHADLVGSALRWAAVSPAAAGGTYNLTNGDVFLWSNVWPSIASVLKMEVGEHRYVSLLEELPRREAEWAAMVDKYSLRASPRILDVTGYNSLVAADGVLGATTLPSHYLPALNSTISVRRAGFADCMDTEDMFVELIERLQAQHIIPSTGPAR
jgi:nucleoside-diphosphate-sugar epimerase